MRIPREEMGWRLAGLALFMASWASVACECGDAAFDPLDEPLEPPELVQPADPTCIEQAGTVVFQWRPVAAAVKYELQIASRGDFAELTCSREETDGTSISVLVSDWSHGRYFWRVLAFNKKNERLASATASFVVAFGLPAYELDPVEVPDCGSPTAISWSDPLEGGLATNYFFQLAADDGFQSVLLEEAELWESRIELPPELALDSGTCYARVRRSYHGCPDRSWAETQFDLVAPPQAPHSLLAEWSGCGPFQVQLGWESENAGTYRVEVQGDTGFEQSFQVAEGSLAFETDLAGAYTWRVALDDGACTSEWAAGEAFEISEGLRPDAPYDLAADWGGCGPFDVALSWSSDQAQASYRVEIWNEIGYQESFETDELELQIVAAAPAAYDWRVQIAADDGCDSLWSDGPTIHVAAGRAWEELETSGEIFSPREGHGVIVSDDGSRIWVLAGDAAGDVADVWTSQDGASWERLTEEAEFGPRRWFASAYFDGRLWVIGGNLNSGSLNFGDVWFSYDGASWTKSYEEETFERHSPAAVVFDDQLWVIGGEGPANCSTTNTVWSSEDGYSWERRTLPDAFSPGRDYHTAVVFDERIWIIGGISRDGACNATYLADVWSSPDGLSWAREVDGLFPVRGGHSSVVYDDKIWIIGGTDSWPFHSPHDVWYSEDGQLWCQAADTMDFSQRYGHASAVFREKIWVIGGYDGQYQNDIWTSE
ncbi:MAG: hypothetical protein JXR96_11065 [Deltaproteobacteria bacterium]|nr:hypothetical protein [Deltaproteobacteria bacterium]